MIELNDKLKYESISFRTISLNKEKDDFISLDLELHRSFNMIGRLTNYSEKSIPIYFTYYSEDDLERTTFISEESVPSYVITDYVNDENIFSEYISNDFFSIKCKLFINLKNHKYLKEKIYTKDYDLWCNYHREKNFFIIRLNYNPNLRKIKLLKIKKKINEKIL